MACSEGHDLGKLAAKRTRKLRAQGLPRGRKIKGQSVIIRLNLSRPDGTQAERRAIKRIMNDLDALLVDPDSDAPPAGSLERNRYYRRECQLVLSGPNAGALVKTLRPWLRKLRWHRGFSVAKRSADSTYVEAPEQIVFAARRAAN